MAKVRGPTLPKNMVTTSKSLLMLCRDGVIPVDKPTVPKADVTSYRTLTKSIFSTSIIIIVIIKIRTMLKLAIEMALLITSCDTFLRNMIVSLFPLIFDAMAITIIPKVVTLMPPPVDPGAAPININRMLVILETSLSSLMGRVLKPAVRQVMDWKTAALIFSNRVNEPIVSGLPDSSIMKKTAPKTINEKDIISTILV